MKKLTLFATLCALLLGSCTTNELDSITPETNSEITLPDLTAAFADEETTKTYVEDGKYLRWHEADLITAFFGNTLNRQYKFKGQTGDNSGTFSLVPSGELGTGNELETIYAVYPYNESTSITEEGTISLTLPATQQYAENSFGKGANTMIAVTESVEDTFLGFKNACGYLKLKLYNAEGKRLRSVVVEGNNEEKIAGAATVAMEFGGVPSLVMGAEATTSVTLDCGEEGVALGNSAESATELWITLPETTFEGGITITATDTEGGTFEKSTTKTVAITRNDIQPMAALGAEFVATKPANNEIWYTSSDGAVVTPYATDVFGANIVSNEWDGYSGVITFDGEVTSIGELAFSGCSSLTSVTIPDSVTEIGSEAFAYCSSLTSVTIPDSVTSIGGGAFIGCESLASVTIGNGVTSIVSYAFYNCSSLASITIPDSVTEIGKDAFYGCTSLPIEDNVRYADTYLVGVVDKSSYSYTIKESTRFIGSSAFSGCSNLTSVTIPDSVTSIGYGAFSGCSNLASVTIGDSVTSIERNTFYKCSSLTSITIPDSVTEIGDKAFSGCSSLASVYCKPTTPPSGGGSMFYNNASGRKIYVPTASVSAYKAASYWSDYASDIEGYDF